MSKETNEREIKKTITNTFYVMGAKALSVYLGFKKKKKKATSR